MELSVKLKKARYARQIKLQELADLIGASKSYIFDLESGKCKNPSNEKLENIASALGVTKNHLINPSVGDVRNINALKAHYDLREKKERAIRDKKRNELIDKINLLVSKKKYKRHEIAELCGTTIHVLDKIIKDKKVAISLHYNCGQAYKKINWQDKYEYIIGLLYEGKKRMQVARHLGVAYSTLCNFIINHCPEDLRAYYIWNDNEIEVLKKIYDEGEYLHQSVLASGRTRKSVKYAVKKYVNLEKKQSPINPVEGEDSWSSVFDNSTVDKIRQDYISGAFSSISDAARAHDVCFQTMHNLLRYKTYTRHLRIDIEKIKELREDMCKISSGKYKRKK